MRTGHHLTGLKTIVGTLQDTNAHRASDNWHLSHGAGCITQMLTSIRQQAFKPHCMIALHRCTPPAGDQRLAQ